MSLTSIQSPPKKRLEEIDPSLKTALKEACPSVSTRVTDRLAYAHDASHYLLTPLAVASPESAEEVAALFSVARDSGIPMTFRSGGTSLSGQAGTAGVLVDTRRHFRSVEVLNGGHRVRTGPGATVRTVNTQLARHGRKLGPDPASEIACTIGGVVANNSSGMACGITANTYRTLDSVVLVLPSGSVIDTGVEDADERLKVNEPVLYAGLERLRDRIRRDAGSMHRIDALYSIKNTMGYGLNSFTDHDRPIDILEHLVIGSEGTLAFVAEATFRTVPVRKHVATGLLLFPTLADATSALPSLVVAGFATIELLDATSLRVAQGDPEATRELRELEVLNHAALLVEYQESTAEDLDERLAQARALFADLNLSTPGALSQDARRRAQLWHIRKGLYTLVAGNRPNGTTALLEDIAVPVAKLYETCDELTKLFSVYGYQDSVIFGHAKDGNIHFMLNESFDQPDNLVRYETFTAEMVELVLSLGGTLKAEHGTGRIMAPFVRRQYGDELYNVMREVKHLFDPTGMLNPGVMINADPHVHIRDLKTAPAVEEEVDRCVECGYCEPVCPSKDLTLTPRQRIVLRREMASAAASGDNRLLDELHSDYQYDGVQTCAVDGMCQTACPVLINTGDLVRRLRAEQASTTAQVTWKAAAQHWETVTRIGGAAMTFADALPPLLPKAAAAVGRAILGKENVPAYSADLPRGGVQREVLQVPNPSAIYFASCTTTMFGSAGGPGASAAFMSLADRAGIKLSTPEDLPSLCCGTPWKSKGLTDGYEEMKHRVAESLLRATRGKELPVVCDASSCTEGLGVILEAAGALSIEVLDAVAFTDTFILPRLPTSVHKIDSVTLHPTCSSIQLGLDESLRRVAAAAAESVNVPDDWGCCAFAGDRGMLHPELTESATKLEKEAVVRTPTTAYVSLNRTCEMGMTRSTGQNYEHILELLDRIHDIAGDGGASG